MSLFSVRKMFTGKTEKKVTVHDPYIYTVTLTYHGDADTRLKFNTEISRMTVDYDTTQYFQITRSDVRINDEDTSDYLASDLAAQCGNVLYPLQLQIGQHGSIQSILNHPAILQRWEEKKSRLKQYFTGPEAHSYIDATGDTLGQESSLLNAIRQDIFLSAFFQVQCAGNRDHFKTSYVLFPFEVPVVYDVIPTGNRMMNNLRQTGREEKGSGALEIKYTFHKIHGLIQSLQAQLDAARDKRVAQITLTASCINSDDHRIN
ncbi:hypothetical protein [Chitinophaga pinensis]|uniref:Uncharacterized protein n=1 Tax=Chitinophaga pinensis TaxID=79329 RepID=A0A5C6LJJ4_9BACT|nr:hypothetical protein [Chitinophaga pinensis]TWV91504.1 hypothetical protein FEF09_28770 [Chitinophaga pinensis]